MVCEQNDWGCMVEGLLLKAQEIHQNWHNLFPCGRLILYRGGIDAWSCDAEVAIVLLFQVELS